MGPWAAILRVWGYSCPLGQGIGGFGYLLTSNAGIYTPEARGLGGLREALDFSQERSVCLEGITRTQPLAGGFGGEPKKVKPRFFFFRVPHGLGRGGRRTVPGPLWDFWPLRFLCRFLKVFGRVLEPFWRGFGAQNR